MMESMRPSATAPGHGELFNPSHSFQHTFSAVPSGQASEWSGRSLSHRSFRSKPTRLSIVMVLALAVLFSCTANKAAAPPSLEGMPPADIRQANSYYFYTESQLALRQANFDKAVFYLKKAIELDPDSDYLKRELARLYVQQKNYDAALTLTAEILAKHPEDVETLIAAAKKPPVVVIAPDRHGTGTNALLMSPPGLIEYDFGPDSFSRHQQRAKQAGAKVVVCELPSLELDLDVPEDLEILQEWRSQKVQIEAEEST